MNGIRFRPIFRTLWLVAKRYHLPRDLRTLVVWLVKRNVFNWESESLRLERAQIHTDYVDEFIIGPKRYRAMQLRGAIILHVEECEPINNPDGDDLLRLTRIKAKRLLYSPSDWFWLRLQY